MMNLYKVKGITGVKNFFTNNRFFQPKVRGTLGTRLVNQPRIPLPGAIAAYSTSPLNPASKNFNPAFEGQLNYLEGKDGFIGRDPNSGGLKYGPESVLSGQNVVSMFGTNDYEKQLDKYIEKVSNKYQDLVDEYGVDSDKATKYKFKFLEKAIKEKDDYTKKTIKLANELEQERIEKERAKTRAADAAAGAFKSTVQQDTGGGGT